MRFWSVQMIVNYFVKVGMNLRDPNFIDFLKKTQISVEINCESTLVILIPMKILEYLSGN